MKKFSTMIMNFFIDISKNFILSVYFLFELVMIFVLYVFVYIESFVFSFSANYNSKTSGVTFFVFSFLNFVFIKPYSFYISAIEFLRLNSIAKIASDILVLVAIFSFFSGYFLSGPAAISFSNEGLWLSILSLIVIYGFYFFENLERNGKDIISTEIEVLKSSMSRSAELAVDISNLEKDFIAFEDNALIFLETWYILMSEIIDEMDSSDSTNSIVAIESIVNDVFNDYLHYCSVVASERDVFDKVVALQDHIEDVVFEIFESYND